MSSFQSSISSCQCRARCLVFVLAGGDTDAADEWLITLNSVKKQKHQRQHQQPHEEMHQQQPGNENSSHLRRCYSPQLEEGFISVVSLSSLHFHLSLITKCPDPAMWNNLIKKTNESESISTVCLNRASSGPRNTLLYPPLNVTSDLNFSLHGNSVIMGVYFTARCFLWFTHVTSRCGSKSHPCNSWASLKS